MCGRYSLICTDDFGNRFRVPLPDAPRRSRFNVAPSQVMPIVVKNDGNRVVMMEWGLVPHWVKDRKKSPHPINARAESLSERPFFRPLLTKNRCLVPASGFYEWAREGTRKQPFYIHLREEPSFAFAGLYDLWTGPDGAIHPTFTIVTTKANSLVRRIHDRMPVILGVGNEERWIESAPLDAAEISRICAPYPPEAMEAYPVSSRVNSPSQDDEDLITRIS